VYRINIISKTFIVLLFLFIHLGVFSQTFEEKSVNELRTIQSLTEQIIVFDEYYNSYVPFINTGNVNYKSGHIWLDLVKYRGEYLHFEAEKNLAVFVNGKFFRKITENKSENIHVSTFKAMFPNENNVFITFYHPSGNWPKELAITTIVSKIEKISTDESQILPVIKNSFNSFFIQCLMLILLLLAVMKMFFRSTFYTFYSYFIYLKSDNRNQVDDETFISNIVNKESVIFILVNSFIMAFSIMILFNYYKFNFYFANIQIYGYWIMWLFISLFIFISYLIKYILLNLFTEIFQISRITNSHYFVFVNFLQKSGLILFVLSVVLFAPLSSLMADVDIDVINFVVIFTLILLLLFIVLQLRTTIAITNFYLFSYLCITEVLPVILIYKSYIASS
jgi:hypothetical protein